MQLPKYASGKKTRSNFHYFFFASMLTAHRRTVSDQHKPWFLMQKNNRPFTLR